MQNFINTQQVPSDLYQKILNKIENEKSIIKIRRRVIVSSFVFVLSISCFVLSVVFFLSAAYHSGFSQIFSLVFSDFAIISSYSTNFILSLLESLPILNIVMFLFMTLVVSFVANFLTKDIKNLIFYSHIKY